MTAPFSLFVDFYSDGNTFIGVDGRRVVGGQAKIPTVVHFEISAERPERAVSFLEKVFGWKIVK